MGFSSNELRNYVYLKGLLETFEKRVLKYCSSGVDQADRFKRIKEIRDALILKEGSRLPSKVSVSAGSGSTYPNCDSDERCDGTACVPGIVISGWPDITDPVEP
jgi:hypothetical protein